MSESTHPSTLEGRFVPRDRQSFFDVQRRNRRATWWLSVLCLLAVVVMGIPLALIITPFLYAVALLVADIVNLFSPLSRTFWQQASEVARFGFVALHWLLSHQPADPRALATGVAVMLLPGAVLSILLWLGMNSLFKHAGVGGALLALKAREPNPGDLKELQLNDVIQEMAIAAGLPAPRVMLIDAPGANAAAIGTSLADARIVVSRRLVDDLSRDEMEGALAHLIGSIGNGDLRIAFRVTSIFETCGLLVAVINSPFGSQSRRTLWRIIRYGLGASGKGCSAEEAAAVAEILSRGVGMDADDIDRMFDTGGEFIGELSEAPIRLEFICEVIPESRSENLGLQQPCRRLRHCSDTVRLRPGGTAHATPARTVAIRNQEHRRRVPVHCDRSVARTEIDDSAAIAAIVASTVIRSARPSRPSRINWAVIEADRIDQLQRRVADVGVAVPGLRVHGIDGREAGGIGRGPAALDAVLTCRKIVDVRGRVLIHAGEVQVRCAALGIGFAERAVGTVIIHRPAGGGC